jgi:hypothetical protein
MKDINMDSIRVNADSFRKVIHSRNMGEWLACLIIIPVFGIRAWNSETLWSRILNGELALAAVLIAVVIFYRGRLQEQSDTELTPAAFIQLQRRNIERQIRLLSKARYWYVAPIAFGLLGLSLERALHSWTASRIPWGSLIEMLAVGALAWSVIWLNEVHGVKTLRKKLESLA